MFSFTDKKLYSYEKINIVFTPDCIFHNTSERSIYNVNGKKLQSGQIINNEIKGLNSLGVGIFILSIEDDNNVITNHKLVKIF